MEQDMRSLGSLPEELVSGQTEFSFAEAAGSDCAQLGVEPSSATADKWLFESGPRSEMLECTRGQIFDEALKLRDDERQRIGQELHDSAGQLLLSLQLTAARLRETELNCGHESLVTEIQDIARLISQEI